MTRSYIFCILACLGIAAFSSCEKLKQTNEVEVNQVPYYDEISTVIVENYLNRMYIDLIGREPLDTEMVVDLAFLRANDLSMAARETIALRLQTDTTARPGDGSYKLAYNHWFYERMLSDLLESADSVDFEEFLPALKDAVKVDSILGDTIQQAIDQAQLDRLLNVKRAEAWYYNGEIGFKEMAAIMVDNHLYDKINMGSFNFINATFEDLFYRFPTASEFSAAFDIVEYSKSAALMGATASNKKEYVQLMTTSREFYTGMIMRGYHRLMVRDPSSAESNKVLQYLYYDNDYRKFQRQLIITDEYAQFKPTYR